MRAGLDQDTKRIRAGRCLRDGQVACVGAIEDVVTGAEDLRTGVEDFLESVEYGDSVGEDTVRQQERVEEVDRQES